MFRVTGGCVTIPSVHEVFEPRVSPVTLIDTFRATIMLS
jgi:hypothetical protein